MDFFAAQDQARRQTRWLLALFVVAVGCLILLTNFAVAVTLWMLQADVNSGSDMITTLQYDLQQPLRHYFSWQNFGWISLWVSSTILLVILFKWLQLRRGGQQVAESLGGMRINPASEEPQYRQLLNVVEEMALAANMPVPPVYLLKGEKGINAFAAGFSPNDAVIGVTQGALEQFDREQLQGVIAHEFSHIVNGDARLNMQIMIVLAGLVFISVIGRFLLHSGGGSGMGRRRGDGRLMLLGVALLIIGWLGSFCGGLIKAAVSRQREFLADAAAVQYTRNPKGISDALKVIGGYEAGSRVFSARADEASHLFISRALSPLVGFDSHPPLSVRIRRLQPDWDGQFIQRTMIIQQTADNVATPTAEADPLQTLADLAGLTAIAGDGTAPSPLPLQLQQQARDSFGAVALCMAMTASQQPELWQQQQAYIRQLDMPGMTVQVQSLLPALATLPAGQRLPLLELAMPALKNLSVQQYRRFKQCLLLIIRSDQQIELFEWCLYQLLRQQLDAEFGLRRLPAAVFSSLQELSEPCHQVLSMLAQQTSSTDQQQVWQTGIDALAITVEARQGPEHCSLQQFIDAVNQLSRCTPLLKPKILKALQLAAAADGEINAPERELLQAIAVVIDCPLPPSLAGQASS